MTRINVIPPYMLSDKHLLAEYRELPRIFTAVLKLQEKGLTPKDIYIPTHYRLGKGHQKFFYDKCYHLNNRFYGLKLALLYRGINTNPVYTDRVRNNYVRLLAHWKREWMPEPADFYLNMARLANRSKLPSVREELMNGGKDK